MSFNILKECLITDNLNTFLNLLINNDGLFINLNKINGNLNIEKFKKKEYTDEDTDNNILLMYRIVESKFYNLIKKVSNRTLEYSKELNNNDSNNKYLVFLTNTKLNLNIMKCYLLFYNLNIKLNNKDSYICVDFEFNTKVVALMQINFEQPNKELFNKSLIFLFHPDQFSDSWKNFFINGIICKSRVFKILHGSDSLDIPYIYNELLNGDKELIIKFNKYFIDTKFICEFNYFNKNMELGKCKINYLLLNEGIINQKVFDKILKNESDMGHIYDIVIDINNLSDELINYTMYDVVYLPHLVDYYKKSIVNFNFINELTQLSLLDKRKVIDYFQKEEINRLNNYISIVGGKTIKLIHLYNKLFTIFCERNKIMNIILKINYFKSTINLIFKFELYYYICRNFTVFRKIIDKEKYLNRLYSSYKYGENIYEFIYKFRKLIEKKLVS